MIASTGSSAVTVQPRSAAGGAGSSVSSETASLVTATSPATSSEVVSSPGTSSAPCTLSSPWVCAAIGSSPSIGASAGRSSPPRPTDSIGASTPFSPATATAAPAAAPTCSTGGGGRGGSTRLENPGVGVAAAGTGDIGATGVSLDPGTLGAPSMNGRDPAGSGCTPCPGVSDA